MAFPLLICMYECVFIFLCRVGSLQYGFVCCVFLHFACFLVLIACKTWQKSTCVWVHFQRYQLFYSLCYNSR
ncbi:unnamed protein product [Phytomonas sp. EM1]|nr:unnamed protein product [Phytomonas sp. EM1]|eukprot:CCW62853.1 unnamed protein product [Phytomonas sp. isolate EM1]